MNHQDMSMTMMYTQVVSGQAVEAILSLPLFLTPEAPPVTDRVTSSG